MNVVFDGVIAVIATQTSKPGITIVPPEYSAVFVYLRRRAGERMLARYEFGGFIPMWRRLSRSTPDTDYIG